MRGEEGKREAVGSIREGERGRWGREENLIIQPIAGVEAPYVLALELYIEPLAHHFALISFSGKHLCDAFLLLRRKHGQVILHISKLDKGSNFSCVKWYLALDGLLFLIKKFYSLCYLRLKLYIEKRHKLN